MKISVIGKNVKITESMNAQIQKKLERIERLFENPDQLTATVLVSTGKLDQTIEISINTGSINLRVKVVDTDMYAALDLAIDRLEGQMRKVKTQIERKTKHKNLAKGFRFDYLQEMEDEVPTIVKRKQLTLTPMDQDEAITRMEALGHSFFIYLDSATGLVNVIYNRDDGAFGLIEVQE